MNSNIRLLFVVISILMIVAGFGLILQGCSTKDVPAPETQEEDEYQNALRDVQRLCNTDQRFLLNDQLYICIGVKGEAI